MAAIFSMSSYSSLPAKDKPNVFLYFTLIMRWSFGRQSVYWREIDILAGEKWFGPLSAGIYSTKKDAKKTYETSIYINIPFQKETMEVIFLVKKKT